MKKMNNYNAKIAQNIYNNLNLAKKGFSKDEMANIEAALDEGKSVDEIVINLYKRMIL
jgi:hypothetical protein